MALNNNYDIAVIGGGPAGTATAYYAAKLGLKTILFEKKTYPGSKPCGGALSARVIPLLGKEALKTINCEIQELRVFSPLYKCLSIKSHAPGYTIRREEFDPAMAKDARDAGAEVMDNCRAKRIRQLPEGDFEITTEKVTATAQYIVLATGFQKKAFIQSPFEPETFEDDYLAMTVVSETPADNRLMASVNFPVKVMAIFFGAVPNGYGWYFVKDGYVNLGIGATASFLKEAGAINAYNRFVANLREKEFLPKNLELKKERAYPLPFKRTVEKSVFGNALLVGDSAGFVSPVTGEGIYYAVKGGQLAAEAIARNLKNGTPLSSYQKNWEKDFGRGLNRYGYFLRELLYKNKNSMELAVKLCTKDEKMALLMNNLVYGVQGYQKIFWKSMLRMPITLAKTIF